MNQEFVKKYGVWIAGGALVLYLAYRNLRGPARQSLIGSAGAAGVSAEQSRLELERLRAAGSLDLERLKIQAAEEAARRKAELDRYNLEQQVAARNRALDAAQRGQTLGLIGQILNSLSGLLRGQQSQGKGGSSGSSGGSGGGGGFPGTPPIAGGRTQPQLPPYYSVPVPSIDTLGSYIPQYPATPEYIPLRIDDWGEAPQFQTSGLDLDTGATFFDQFGGDWDYSSGFFSGPDFGGFDLFSDLPEATSPTEGQVAVSPEEYAASEGYIIEGTDFDYGYGY